MKRALLIATVSSLVLVLSALPLAAQTVAPVEGGATPAPNEETLPPAAPVTPHEACVAEASGPATCEGVPVTPPAATCPPEGCQAVDVPPEEPQVNQAAMMAAEQAASEAVADILAGEEDPSGAVDSTDAYIAGLSAAREAAREVGADEETAQTLAKNAAIGAVAREAASDAATGDEGSRAVDGAAAYLAALGAAREAGASEERAPIVAGRAVATRSGEESSDSGGSDSVEAGSTGDEDGVSKDETAEDEEPSEVGGTPSSEKDETLSAGSAAPAAGEASPTAEEEEPFEAVSTALPAAQGTSPLVLAAGALLVVAGIAGLLIRRGLALRGSRKPEEEQAGGEASSPEGPSGHVRRLPQRTVR